MVEYIVDREGFTMGVKEEYDDGGNMVIIMLGCVLFLVLIGGVIKGLLDHDIPLLFLASVNLIAFSILVGIFVKKILKR